MYPESAAMRYASLLAEPVERLVHAHPHGWRLDACGVTPATRSIPALVHPDAYDLASNRMRVLVVGGLAGGAGDVELAVRVLEAFAGEVPEIRRKIALSAVPCANPDGLALETGPGNGAGGNPTAGYPPGDGFFNHPRDAEARYLWRWVCQQAPDLVVELHDGDSPCWEANPAAMDLARGLGPASLVPAGSLLRATEGGGLSGRGRIPGLRLTSAPQSGVQAATKLWRLLAEQPAPVRSTAAAVLASRRARPALDVARLLAGVYGHRLEPVVYTQGVGVSGRLRLHELDPAGTANRAGSDPVRDVASLVEPCITGVRAPFKQDAGGQDLAGVVWAEELHRITGDRRYLDLLVDAAKRYAAGEAGAPPPPADPDFRTEDIFFTAAVLGRAYRMTGDDRYAEILAPYMQAVARHQQPDGLFWHCRSAPYYWGRGNGFAALGFAEALTYLPARHPLRTALVQTHRRHIQAIARTQAPSGMLRQVLDFPGSYEELSATCMVGYAVARGIRLGWLDRPTVTPILDRLWTAAMDHIDERGQLVDVCTGTGVQPDLRAYLDRAAISGYDDRGGSLALWFAVEMAACILSPSQANSDRRT